MKKIFSIFIVLAFGLLSFAHYQLMPEVAAFSTPSLAMKWINASSDGYPVYSEANKTLGLTPRVNTSMPEVNLQFEFSLASGDTAQPGEIEIRIPRYIFQTRTGANEGAAGTLDLPLAPATGVYGFNYTVSGNEYIIKNYRAFTHSENLLCQMTYNFRPSNVKNGFHKNVSITASLTQSGGTPVSFSDSIDVTVNTVVAKPPLTKTFNSKYESWQAAWGTYPDNDDPDDYYYVVWQIYTSTLGFGGSQPAILELQDILGDLGGGEIIGAAASSGANQNFTNKPPDSEAYDSALKINITPSTSSHSGSAYYRCILAKYPRNLIPDEPNIENTVYANVTGTDNNTGTPDFTWDVNAKYTYTAVVFNYAGDLFGTSKNTFYSYGSSSYGYGNANGAINKLLRGNPESPVTVSLGGKTETDSYTFSIFSSARGYGLTRKDGGLPNNPEDYGHKSYTTELVDDLLFLDNKLLNKDDYSMTHCYLAFNEYDWSQNPNSGVISELVSADYPAYSEVELWYKSRNSGDNWIKSGNIKRTGAATYEYSGGGYTLQNDIGTGAGSGRQTLTAGSQIALPEGTYAIKFIHTGSRYEVKMRAYFTIELYSTQNIMNILTNKATSTLLNVNSLVIRDSDNAIRNIQAHTTISDSSVTSVKSEIMKRDNDEYGTVYTNYGTSSYTSNDTAVQHANSTLILRSVTPYTSITKNAAAVVDDKSSARKTSIQTINIYEYCQYAAVNIGIDEIIANGAFSEQLEGTFYDLLPAGTTFDMLDVKTYGTKLPCDFTYSTVNNWQGSGRTMLIVHAAARESTNRYFTTQYDITDTVNSGFTLTFRLINSYENILDNGISARNFVAYRTASDHLSGGTTASATYNYFQSLETQPPLRDDDNKDTVYANVTVNFPAPATAVYGITKRVKAQDDADFGVETAVVPGGLYTYRLRFENSRDGGTAEDLIIYDVLENEPDSDWKGTFESIDTSFAESKGINPVIYYATESGLAPFDIPEHADLTDIHIWSTTRPANPTAIAIDFSLRTDGQKQIFGVGESMYCLLNMRAPTNWEEIGSKLAVNKISYSTLYTLNEIATPTAKESDITRVSLRDLKFEISKEANPKSGTSDNPESVIRGDIIEYTVTIKNADSVSVTDVKVEDILPDGFIAVTDDLKYYSGTNPAYASPITGSSRINAAADGQNLTFFISEMYAMETINLMIPVRVENTFADGAVIINDAVITEINGAVYEIRSNETYHEVLHSLVLTGNKLIIGADESESSLEGYMFELAEVTDESGDTRTPNGIVLTAESDAEGLFAFDEIQGLRVGVYYFKISEIGIAPENWTYAPSKIVKVTVDNEMKTIEWLTEYGEVTNSTFINTYTVPPPETTEPTTEETTTEPTTEETTTEPTTEETTTEPTTEETTTEPTTEETTTEPTTEETTTEPTTEETTTEPTTEETTTEPTTEETTTESTTEETTTEPTTEETTTAPTTEETTTAPTTEETTTTTTAPTTEEMTTTTTTTTALTTEETTATTTTTTAPTTEEMTTTTTTTTAPTTEEMTTTTTTTTAPTTEEMTTTTTTTTAPTTEEMTTTETTTLQAFIEPTISATEPENGQIIDDIILEEFPSTRIPLANGWFAEDVGDSLYEIFDENGIPLGYLKLDDSENIEEWKDFDNLIPFTNPEPDEPDELKNNPTTGDLTKSILILGMLFVLITGIILNNKRSRIIK